MSNTAFRCGISTSLRLVSAPQVKKMMESTALAALGDRLRRLTDSAHPAVALTRADPAGGERDRKSTRLNSSHSQISYAVFCLKKKKKKTIITRLDYTAH